MLFQLKKDDFVLKNDVVLVFPAAFEKEKKPKSHKHSHAGCAVVEFKQVMNLPSKPMNFAFKMWICAKNDGFRTSRPLRPLR